MKIKLVAILLFLLLIITCSERNRGFKIGGNAIGFIENTTLYLEDLYAHEIIDSTRIADGQFKFFGKVEEPSNYVIRTNNYSYVTRVWLDNSNITLEIRQDNSELIKISGSAAQNKIFELQVRVRRLKDTLSGYKNWKIIQGGSIPSSRIRVEKDSILQQIDKKYVDYIEDNPNDYYSAYLLFSIIERIGKKQAAQLYNNFLPEVQKSNYGTYAYRYIRYSNELKIGGRAKNFGMRNVKGDIIYLNDFKGDFLLLSFWIAGNGVQPNFSNHSKSVEMNKDLNRFYKKYHSRGLNILSVSLDKNKQDWLKGISRNKLIWHNVCDSEGFHGIVPITYNIKSVPTIILLGPDMYIVETDLLKIEELLDRIY